ncbi:MAG: YdiY family protein [Chromatocurvus sp.]
MPLLRALLPAAVLLCAAVTGTDSANAATVVMSNGERFSGDIISMIDGKLLLKNEYAGEITLPWSAVTELISDEPLRLQLPDESVVTSTTTSAAPGSLELAEKSAREDQVLPLVDIAAINRPLVNPYEYEWRGKSNVGLNATTGNSDTTRFHVDTEGTLENDVDRYIAGVDFNRGSDNDVTSVDNWTAYGSYDHFFSDRLFWNNSLSFKRNTLQELDLRSAIGTGVGYQFFDDSTLRLSTTAGLSYVREQFDVQSSEEFVALQLGADYEHRWFDWLQFFHSLQTLTSLESVDDFVLRTRTGLRYPIGDNFVASLQVNVDYDNTPSEGAEKEDIIYVFTLGYGW